MFSYQLIKSAKRRSIALQIKSGKVVVRAPDFVSSDYIDRLISKKKEWIETKLEKYRCLHNTPCEEIISLRNGGAVWFKGIRTSINVGFANKANIEVINDFLIVTLKESLRQQSQDKQNKKIRQLIESWMKECAIDMINDKVSTYSKLTNLTPSSVYIRRYKARWGSCNNRGQLNFNYLLVMVPDWVVDYVVIHELCHLKHLNHSNEFWQLVALHFPEFKKAKLWLKQHQNQLSWPI